MDKVIIGIGMVIAGVICLLIYIIPTIIAFNRNHHFKLVILAINIIFGVTGIGYLIALVWAVWPEKTAIVDLVTNDLISAKNNQQLYMGRGENARAYDAARYGATQQPGQMPVSAQQYGDNPQTKACPYCGEQIAFKAIKCRHCKENL